MEPLIRYHNVSEVLEPPDPLNLRDTSDPHAVALELADHAAQDGGVADAAGERLFQHLVASEIDGPAFGLPPNDAAFERAHEDAAGDALGAAERPERWEQE